MDPNARLKAAVKSEQVPPFLDAKIRRNLQSSPRFTERWKILVPLTALAGLVMAAVLFYRNDGGVDQEHFFATVTAKVSTLMRVGLGDHIHCAVLRTDRAKAPAVEAIQSELGPKYKDLVPVVRANVPERYRLRTGHVCANDGRRFLHFVLSDDSRLLSIVITAKKQGERFDVERALPAMTHAGIPIYTSAADRFQIAATETSQHLIYFISDLPAEQNHEIMRALAGPIQLLLANLEA
jgi:hypothetical protein